MNGSTGGDHLFGGADDSRVTGNAGNDVLDGGEGKDLLYGGDGLDILLGAIGNDMLAGGAAADVFVYSMGDGNDRIGDFQRRAGRQGRTHPVKAVSLAVEADLPPGFRTAE